MNKTVKVIIFIVILIWIFATGLITGTFIARNSYKKQNAADRYASASSSSENAGINIDIVTDVPTTSEPDTRDFTLELPSNYNSFSTYEYEAEN